jgi:antitoxin MazE
MHVTVQKWGNSLGVRIPKSVTKDTKIEEGTEVDLTIEKGSIVLKPLKRYPSISELLSLVTDDNIHKETNTGDIIGREIW